MIIYFSWVDSSYFNWFCESILGKVLMNLKILGNCYDQFLKVSFHFCNISQMSGFNGANFQVNIILYNFQSQLVFLQILWFECVSTVTLSCRICDCCCVWKWNLKNGMKWHSEKASCKYKLLFFILVVTTVI